MVVAVQAVTIRRLRARAQIRNPKLEIRNKSKAANWNDQSHSAHGAFGLWPNGNLSLLRISSFGFRIHAGFGW